MSTRPAISSLEGILLSPAFQVYQFSLNVSKGSDDAGEVYARSRSDVATVTVEVGPSPLGLLPCGENSAKLCGE